MIDPDYWNRIPGWTSKELHEIYREAAVEALADEDCGSRLVEIGAWLGRSTAFMCTELAKAGVERCDKSVHFYTVDTFLGSPTDKQHQDYAKGQSVFPEFYSKMARGGLLHYVTPLVMMSTQAAQLFPDRSLSFVFIDGDHIYSQVWQDIHDWLPKVTPGGVIAGHDFGSDEFPGVTMAVKELVPGFIQRGDCWWWRKT
jgi:hypothetical protein